MIELYNSNNTALAFDLDTVYNLVKKVFDNNKELIADGFTIEISKPCDDFTDVLDEADAGDVFADTSEHNFEFGDDLDVDAHYTIVEDNEFCIVINNYQVVFINDLEDEENSASASIDIKSILELKEWHDR